MPGFRDIDRMGQRLSREIGIDQGNDRAHARQTKPNREILRAIRQDQADDVAEANLMAQSPSRIPIGLLCELPISKSLIFAGQRFRILELIRQCIDQNGKRDRGILSDWCGHLERAHP